MHAIRRQVGLKCGKQKLIPNFLKTILWKNEYLENDFTKTIH